MPKNNHIDFFESGIVSSIATIKRTLAGFVIEHPLNNIATLLQANPATKPFDIFKSSFTPSGFLNLYRGGIPFLLKTYLRSTFHTTGIIYFRSQYERLLSEANINNVDLKNIFAGFTMTTISNVVINPLNRIGVYLVTKTPQSRLVKTYNFKEIYAELRRGFLSNYCRSILSWSLFLMTEERLRLWLNQGPLFRNESSAYLSWPNLLALGILGGGINLFFTLPLETVTIHIQKAHSTHHKMWPTAKFVMKEYGVKGFYVAWPIKLTQYILTTMLSSYAIQAAHSIQQKRLLSANTKEEHSMSNDGKKEIQPRLTLYSQTVMWGIIRGVFSLPFEHPFDRIKTTMQLHPDQTSKEIVSGIYRLHNPNGSYQGLKGFYYGLKGFYTGGIPNTIRAASKQAYRWPLQFALPNFYSNLFGDEIEKQYPGMKKLATGFTIAGLETYFITPLERVKVWFMSAEKGKATFRNFMIQPNLLHEYYRGTSAVMLKQFVSWSTYLYPDYKFREYAHAWTGKKQLEFLDLLIVSIGVALINTAAVMPFDAVKTRTQAAKLPAEANNFHEVIKLMIKIYQEAGIRGLYAGTRWKLIQYFINSCFTVTAMDYFEDKFKENRLNQANTNLSAQQTGLFASKKENAHSVIDNNNDKEAASQKSSFQK